MAKKTDAKPEVKEVVEYKENAFVARLTQGNVSEYDDILDLAENMEGVAPRLPQITIVHAGQMFKFSDSDNKADTITGVILDTNRANAWWAGAYTGEGARPDCSSLDGIAPEGGEMMQAEACAECPQNEYGTSIGDDGEAGPGKACKNMRRVHILTAESKIPYRLTLPPSGLGAWDQYVTSLTGKSLPYQAVVTTIALIEKRNKKGIAFSEPVFLAEGDPIPPAQVKAVIIPERNNWLSAMRGQDITSEEA